MMMLQKADSRDLDQIASLYDAVIDYLDQKQKINYPGWLKGIYPNRQTACDGLNEGSLFILNQDDLILGSVILNHVPEKAYQGVSWKIDCQDHEMLVVRTLAIHPDYLYQGLGKQMMGLIKKYALSEGMKTIRLDVCIQNTPAIRLYERSDYQYIDTVDLGLNLPHLKWFRLYEMVLV